MCVGLSLATSTFLTVANLFNLLNTSSVNLIFAVGLLVVLIAGGIDISFAVAASVVQYVVGVDARHGSAAATGRSASSSPAVSARRSDASTPLIYYFRIISIVVTIATFNIFFGLLMFFTSGVSIYNLPDWWTTRIAFVSIERRTGAPI